MWWKLSTGETETCMCGYNDLITGDDPVGLMGDAFARIINVYMRKWKRKPRRCELQAAFNSIADIEKLED